MPWSAVGRRVHRRHLALGGLRIPRSANRFVSAANLGRLLGRDGLPRPPIAILVDDPERVGRAVAEMRLEGKLLPTNLIAADLPGERHSVEVLLVTG